MTKQRHSIKLARPFVAAEWLASVRGMFLCVTLKKLPWKAVVGLVDQAVCACCQRRLTNTQKEMAAALRTRLERTAQGSPRSTTTGRRESVTQQCAQQQDTGRHNRTIPRVPGGLLSPFLPGPATSCHHTLGWRCGSWWPLPSAPVTTS